MEMIHPSNIVGPSGSPSTLPLIVKVPMLPAVVKDPVGHDYITYGKDDPLRDSCLIGSSHVRGLTLDMGDGRMMSCNVQHGDYITMEFENEHGIMATMQVRGAVSLTEFRLNVEFYCRGATDPFVQDDEWDRVSIDEASCLSILHSLAHQFSTDRASRFVPTINGLLVINGKDATVMSFGVCATYYEPYTLCTDIVAYDDHYEDVLIVTRVGDNQVYGVQFVSTAPRVPVLPGTHIDLVPIEDPEVPEHHRACFSRRMLACDHFN